MNELLNETIEIAQAAGAAIKAYYRDSFSVRDKSPDNPVTDADLAADHLLKERLRALLPDAGWLSEETADMSERLSRRYCWVVDPLDGTKEFVMGIPEFAVSIGLVLDGQPILGVIYNPASGELFHAVRDQGTCLNGQPVHVSQVVRLVDAAIDASRSERKRGEFEAFEKLVDVRTMGSIAYKLARVAAGLADATWSRGPKNEWDICAGTLLVTEGGGRCVNLDDEQLVFNLEKHKVNGVIATNGHLHEQVLAALAPHRATARVD